jgi:N-acetylmuramoyl-L-alanine amidase
MYSRPGLPLRPVKAVVVHYVGNPGTSAMMNRDFFESRKHGMLG